MIDLTIMKNIKNTPPPYHLFKTKDKFFVFDLSSCRFYKIDDKEVQLLAKNGLFDIPDFSMTEEQMDDSLNKAYKIPIMGLELALAESCNLACKYCYCNAARDIPNHGLMTEQVAHQAVLWLFNAAEQAKSPKVNITFFGGETLLNKPVISSIVAYSQLLAKMKKKE